MLTNEIYHIIYTTLYVTFFLFYTPCSLDFLTAFFLSGRFDPISKILKIILNTLLSLPTVTVGLFVYMFLMQKGPFGPMHLLFTKKAIIIGSRLF